MTMFSRITSRKKERHSSLVACVCICVSFDIATRRGGGDEEEEGVILFLFHRLAKRKEKSLFFSLDEVNEKQVSFSLALAALELL